MKGRSSLRGGGASGPVDFLVWRRRQALAGAHPGAYGRARGARAAGERAACGGTREAAAPLFRPALAQVVAELLGAEPWAAPAADGIGMLDVSLEEEP